MDEKHVLKWKNDIEQEIKKRNFDSLRYVLFDETKRLPWAFHLYQKNGKFYVDGRDDRTYIIGHSEEHENFEDAKQDFFERLELVIETNKLNKQLGLPSDYSSPLWDECAIQLVTDTIDAIGVVDGVLELLLADPNHWFVKDEQDHLLKLQEKLNNYIHFIESKQYVDSYGDDFTEKVINLTFQYAPSDNGLAFLVQVQKVLQPTDIRLKVIVPE
ncbi:TPA: Imm59 family immunity protein [Streptococcus suis]